MYVEEITMHEEVKKCVETHDIKRLRYIFVDCLDVDPTFEKYKEDYEICEGLSGLFDPYQELNEIKQDKNKWTMEYWEQLKVDLMKNFAKMRFEHMIEVAKVVYSEKVIRLQQERIQERIIEEKRQKLKIEEAKRKLEKDNKQIKHEQIRKKQDYTSGREQELQQEKMIAEERRKLKEEEEQKKKQIKVDKEIEKDFESVKPRKSSQNPSESKKVAGILLVIAVVVIIVLVLIRLK